MGVDDAERIARAEVADGQPALARLAIERAVGTLVDSGEAGADAARAVVRAVARGGDVELGVTWRLVDDDGRPIGKIEVPMRTGRRR